MDLAGNGQYQGEAEWCFLDNIPHVMAMILGLAASFCSYVSKINYVTLHHKIKFQVLVSKV